MTRQIALAVRSDTTRILDEPIRAPHYIGLMIEGGVPDGLAGHLAQNNIFVSVRGVSVRITPHLYIEPRDISRLIDELAKI